MKKQQKTHLLEQGLGEGPLSSNQQRPSQGTKADGHSDTHISPLRLFIIASTAIFIAEVVAMIVVYFIEPLPYHLTTLVDAGIMTILIFPVLYYFSFLPLIRQMQKSWQAEESLLQARQLQERFFDSIDTLIAYMDRDFNFIRVNDAYARAGGYSTEYLAGKNHFDLYPHAENQEIFQRVIETGEGYIVQERPFEYPDQPECGVTYWNWSLQPVKNSDGEVEGVVLSLVEVTERKRAEEQLRRTYEDLEVRVQDRTEKLQIANSELEDEIKIRKRAEEIAHLGSWELDFTTNQLSWSDEVYQIFGLQRQEFSPSYATFLEVVHPEDRAAVDKAYSDSIQDGRDGYEIEHRLIRHSTGEIRVVHEKCEHLRDESGQIIRSTGMVHDITERKRAEEQLRYQAALISNVNDAIVAADAQFCITAWNAGAETLYGWKVEEVIGHNGLEIVRTEWTNTDANEMRRTISDVGHWRGEATQIRRDGVRFPVEISSMALRDNSGQIIAYISVNRDITERKRAEDALRRSEALLLQTGTMAKIGGWELDLQTMTLHWSPETYRIYEIDPSLSPTLENAIHFYAPEVQPVIREAVQRAIEEGRSYDLELPFVTAKGNALWIRTIGQPEFNDDNCVRLFGTFQDITRRKRAEEELRLAHDELEMRVRERTAELATANEELVKEIAERKEVEAQLRIQTTAMEAAANGIVITDRHGTIQWANPALLQISGYDSAELIGQNMNIFKSGQQDEPYYRDMWETILSGQVWQGELTNRRKDGRLYVEGQTIAPVWSDHDRITHFIAIKQDITERKQADEALRGSEEKFRTLVEWTYDWEIWLDPRGNVVYNSPSCERITGYCPEEIVADPELIMRIIHPDDQATYQNHRRIIHTEAAGTDKLEYRIISRDGQEHWIEHICRPLFGTDNRYLGRRVSNRDVTEQKHAEKHIRERNQKEKILTQTIHTMQLDIARDLHDTIGQNISFLRMKLDYLAGKKIRKRAEMQLELQSMARAADESYDLMRGTLAVLQSENSTDLFRLFTRYAEQIEERSSFKIDLSTHGEVRFMSARRMRQLFYIFREVLNNIEKHANASQVSIKMTWDQDCLNLLVFDNGGGFELDKVQYGSHYGLKFMRERVELLNGSILIRSAIGSGTEITLQVPYE